MLNLYIKCFFNVLLMFLKFIYTNLYFSIFILLSIKEALSDLY